MVLRAGLLAALSVLALGAATAPAPAADTDGDGADEVFEDVCPGNNLRFRTGCTGQPAPYVDFTRPRATSVNCPSPCVTFVDQLPDFELPYVPHDGVLVRWRVKDRAPLATYRLHVLRRNDDGTLREIGVSDPVPPLLRATGAIDTFLTRIPVRERDIVALEGPNQPGFALPGARLRTMSIGDGRAGRPDEPGAPGLVVLSSGDVEYDRDGDDYGDTTQDECVANPERHAGCQADLELKADVSPHLDRYTYGHITMTVTNHGPDPVADLFMRWPFDLPLVTGSSPVNEGSCASSHRLSSCFYEAIDPGQTVTFTTELQSNAGGTFELLGSVTSDGVPDPDLSNNRTRSTVVADERPWLAQLAQAAQMAQAGSQVAPAGAAAPPFVSPSTPGPKATLRTRALVVSSKRATTVRVKCPSSAPGGCRRLRVDLKRGSRRVGRKTLKNVKAGKTANARFHVTRATRRAVPRKGKLRLKAAVRATDARAKSRTATYRVTLRRQR